MAGKHTKDAQQHMSSGNYKLNNNELPHTPIRMAKILTTPNAEENVEQQELSLLMGMENGTASLEESLTVSTK